MRSRSSCAYAASRASPESIAAACHPLFHVGALKYDRLTLFVAWMRVPSSRMLMKSYGSG